MRDDEAADLEEYGESLRLLGRLRLFTASVLLFSCCGCPPSQEEQQRSVTSRWITVEPSGQQQDPFVAEFLFEDLIFRSPVFNHFLLLAIDPTSQDREIKLPGVKDEVHDQFVRVQFVEMDLTIE